MTKTAKHIFSLWLVFQILVSSVGFTLIERKCSRSDAKGNKEACCKPKPAPKEKPTTAQKPSCCSKKSFEEIFGEEEHSSEDKATQDNPKSCCGDDEQEHNCCTFDAAYHHIAFKNYTISTKKHEIKQQKQLLEFASSINIDSKHWLSLTTHAPPKHSNPPPKPSKHLLSLYAIFLI